MNFSSKGPVIVRTEGLALYFDEQKTHALDGVDLEVRAGEFVAVVGPSGCGKSSLLNLVGMLDYATSGEIWFRSRPYSEITERSDFRRDHIGFIFQSFFLLATLSALDNVMVATVGRGGKANALRERARALLVRLGLEARLGHFPAQLSGGERQRVAIARALINEPDIILADEPTGSLDSQNTAAVLEVIAQVRRERELTVLMVTHDQSVSRSADRTIPMRDGKIVTESGSPA